MENSLHKGAKGCLLASIIIGVIYLLGCLLVYLNRMMLVRFFASSLDPKYLEMPVGILVNIAITLFILSFSLIMLKKNTKIQVKVSHLKVGVIIVICLYILDRLIGPFISNYEVQLIGYKYGSKAVAAWGIMNSMFSYINALFFINWIFFFLGIGIWIGSLGEQVSEE